MRNGQRKGKPAQAVIGDAPSRTEARDAQKVYSQNGIVKPGSDVKDDVKALQKHIAGLTRQLQEMKNQKEELEHDVELLCAQQTSSLFDSSFLLSEKAFSAEKGLRVATAQLAAISDERDDLVEKLKGHLDTIRSAKESLRTEQGKSNKLENDLEFYQEQSARFMSDCDQAKWEKEELQRIKGNLEEKLSQAENNAEAAQAEQAELELRLSDAHSKIEDPDRRAKEAKKVPGLEQQVQKQGSKIAEQSNTIETLRSDLQTANDLNATLSEEGSSLQHKVLSLEGEMEDARSKAAAEANSSAETIKTLQARVYELEEANAGLEARADEVDGSLAAWQAEAEGAATQADARLQAQQQQHSDQQTALEASYTAKLADLEVESQGLREKLRIATEEREQAVREKVNTLLRASQAEQTAEQAFEETGNLLQEVNDLKATAAQATQEKLSALQQLADLQQQVRNPNAAPPATSSASPTRTSWRFWSASQPTQSEGSEVLNHDAPGRQLTTANGTSESEQVEQASEIT